MIEYSSSILSVLFCFLSLSLIPSLFLCISLFLCLPVCPPSPPPLSLSPDPKFVASQGSVLVCPIKAKYHDFTVNVLRCIYYMPAHIWYFEGNHNVRKYQLKMSHVSSRLQRFKTSKVDFLDTERRSHNWRSEAKIFLPTVTHYRRIPAF